MNTSRKLLITVAISLMVFVVASLVVLRSYLRDYVATSDMVTRYSKVESSSFSSLKVGSGYALRIFQSREVSLELDDASLSKYIRVENDQLIFESIEREEPVRVRIKMPDIRRIEAIGNSSIWLANYTQDTLDIEIRDSVEFTSADNKIVNLAIQTNGKARVVVKDNPMN